jgi:hypothetical protein
MTFDASSPTLDLTNQQVDGDWKPLYGDLNEEDLRLGKLVDISCFVNANHAGTRRSHTGILIFVQNALIMWYLKKQNTVESSKFGTEFVALRVARDLLVVLRIQLKMFGVLINGLVNVFCLDQQVVCNTSVLESI